MQLAALTALRATQHRFISPEFRAGPFFYTLTDLSQNNIFVDKDWNIQTIIDLEWARSLPIEMQLPPFWLSSRAVDIIEGERIAEHEAVLGEYLAIYEEEERRRNGGSVVQAEVKRDVWKRGSFWFFNAAFIPKGMYNIFSTHIQKLFNKDHVDRKVFDDVAFWYWGFGAQETIDNKIKDREEYLVRVREAFADDDEEDSESSTSSSEEASSVRGLSPSSGQDSPEDRDTDDITPDASERPS